MKWSRRIVGGAAILLEVFNSISIWLQLFPSAKASTRRARNTSPAGKVRDCAQRVSSSRCSCVNWSTR